MGIATATIANAEEFQRVLDTPEPVFVLFVSEHCPACNYSGPLFTEVASQYPLIKSLVLDTANTPRHPEVTGTPTLLVYQSGKLIRKLQGFGPEEEQKKLVKQTFKDYTKAPRPVKPHLARP